MIRIESGVGCMGCGARFPPATFGPCPACGVGVLEASPPEGTLLGGDAGDDEVGGIWRHSEMLPAIDRESRATLGEGRTPLLRLDLGRVVTYAKMEGSNPTHSYKDRFNAVNVSVASILGYEEVVLSSTGNAGLSAACYCAAVGLRARVLCPVGVPTSIVRAMRSTGAEVVECPAVEHAPRLAESVANGSFPGSRPFPGGLAAPASTPWGVEGYKTIAYEIVREMGRTPDAVLVPIGGGDGLYGIYKGFAELAAAKIIDAVPRMIGVHTRTPWASSICLDTWGSHALRAIQESNGAIVPVSEADLRDGLSKLARLGVLVEPASSVPICASLALSEREEGWSSWQVVCVLTSSAAKWWEQIPEDLR